MANRITNSKCAAVLENPRNSSIFTKSPLKTLSSISSTNIIDQCQYGAIDENKIPIQKTTKLMRHQINLSKTNLKCTGDKKCAMHSSLQECLGGIPRTALSAVLPWLLCLSLALDFAVYLCATKESENIQQNISTGGSSTFEGWSCERCKYGREIVHPDGSITFTPSHTRAIGCRYRPDQVPASQTPPGGVPIPAAAIDDGTEP